MSPEPKGRRPARAGETQCGSCSRPEWGRNRVASMVGAIAPAAALRWDQDRPGAKAPGQRPTRPRPAPDPPTAGASHPPGRALASASPGPAGLPGTIARRGGGNAGRLSLSRPDGQSLSPNREDFSAFQPAAPATGTCSAPWSHDRSQAPVSWQRARRGRGPGDGDAQGRRRNRHDGWASPPARVGLRMTALSSRGCPALKIGHRRCRPMTGGGSPPCSAPNPAHRPDPGAFRLLSRRGPFRRPGGRSLPWRWPG